ncbi:MAG: DUF4892 domain-containing protein [Reyranellaceae bacterium]
MRRSIFALAAPLALALTGAALAQSDVAGSADHPAVGRYENSTITFYQSKAYEEVKLPVKALERGQRNDASAWQDGFSGKLTSIRYEGPADRSILEVMRNYEAALKSKGFEISFFCRGAKDCAPGGSVATFWEAARGAVGMPTTWDTSTYLLAERKDAAGVVSVGILGVETKARATKPQTPHVAMTIVEGKPMETGKIKVIEADEIEQALARDGRIAIYGIYFDFDKAEIKPESQPQIAQLGALLKGNPALEVIIVGHTDGKGAMDYNLSLSQRRAKAVADALAGDHGIAPSRLTPAGAGMVAPIATNRTEEGRAKNRRVEIVERYTGR